QITTKSTLFPYTTLFRSKHVRRGLPVQVIPALAVKGRYDLVVAGAKGRSDTPYLPIGSVALAVLEQDAFAHVLLVRERELKRKKDRKSTRLNSSHVKISY